MRVEVSRIRKEKVADSKICGSVWTGRKYVQRDLGTLTKEAIISSRVTSFVMFIRDIDPTAFNYCGLLDK